LDDWDGSDGVFASHPTEEIMIVSSRKGQSVGPVPPRPLRVAPNRANY